MKKRILSYRSRIDQLLECDEETTDWEQVMEEHLIQVQFFQHERLIHLIVTALFALLTMMAFGILLVTSQLPVMALCLVLLILLVPYIAHYYLLENETQKMYEQYDKILRHVCENKRKA